ncbi:hypothetical protein NL676_014385 [Syzygium grande]|nr:hypothetical protein NL676_014385 [Syzygium grande]
MLHECSTKSAPNHTEAVNMIFGDENEKPFSFNMVKLEELLTIARDQPKEGNVSREEKIYCLAKMAALGIIQPLQGRKPEGSIETAVIDLSSEKFSCKFAGEVSCSKPKDDGYEPDVDEPWSNIFSDGDLECESKNAHRGREFMKKAIEKGEIVDTLGQPSSKYDFIVKYTPPLSFFIDPKDIIPDG